jgi:hypothetical protein
VNDLYSVQEYAVESAWGEVRHFAIRRHDGDKDIPWADKQRIKNDLAGSERIALEVFPAEAELVDEANLYHLWILPPGMSLPFSLHGGAS